MDKIEWEIQQGAHIADFAGMRLHVRRAGKSKRDFVGKIDGEYIGAWDGLNMAKARVARKAKDNRNQRLTLIGAD